MPLDRTHQHISTDIMQVDAVHTPISPTGGGSLSVTDGATTVAAATSLHVPPGAAVNLGANAAGIRGYSEAALDLSAVDIAALNSVPFELVPAQGVGTTVMPVAAALQFLPGDEPFAQDVSVYVTNGDSDASGATLEMDSIGFDALAATIHLSFPASQGGAQGDQENRPLVLVSATEDPGYTGAILTSTVFGPGDRFVVGDTFTLSSGVDGATDADGVVDGTTNGYPITAVNQGAKSFTVTGNQSSRFSADDTLVVVGSTGNDGSYTVVSAIFGAGSTVIVVVEDIPDNTADGLCGNDNLGDVGQIDTYHLTTAGTRFAVQDCNIVPTSGIGQDGAISVTSVTPLSDGVARLVVQYFIMSLLS